MNMRLAYSAGLAMASLAGCSTRDDAASDTVGQTSAALTGTFTLRNYASGLCLGIATSGFAVASTCDGSTNQNWQQGSSTDDPAYFKMVNCSASNKCLWKNGYYSANGTYYYYQGLASCLDLSVPSYRHYFVGTLLPGLDCYNFEDVLSRTFVLGTENGSLSVGAKVVISTYLNDPEQIWCVPHASGGY